MAKEYSENPFDVINAAFHGIYQGLVRGATLGISKAIFSDPATIVIWSDGVKTVVRCQDGDVYDARTGLLLCCAKRLFGNTGRYNDQLSATMEGCE